MGKNEKSKKVFLAQIFPNEYPVKKKTRTTIVVSNGRYTFYQIEGF